MVSAMAVVPFMDAIAKHLSSHLPVIEIVWARYFFHFIFFAPFALYHHGKSALWPKRPLLQLTRGGFLLGSTILFFAALAKMPIADALALVFVSPLIVTALAPAVLGEKVGIRRWAAVFVGFAGALIIIKPGSGVLQGASLLALGAGIVYSFYLLSTRKLSGSAPPIVTLTFTALLGALSMSLLVIPVFIMPDRTQLLLMVLMGVIAACGHYLIIKSLEMASASLLAPLSYSEIVVATILGYVIFGDLPDIQTWIGIFIIVCCGLYISWRERAIHGIAKTPG
jgi:drug/metabolite transporter (DMT)-like permease